MKKLKSWSQTKSGILAIILMEIAGAYVFASLAINSAHTWQWATALILAISAVRQVWLLIRKSINGHKQISTTKQN